MSSSAAIDYNPFLPTFYTDDPFATYRRMRDEAPVWRSEQFGWYALTRFEDVRTAVLDADLYRSFEGMDIDNTFSEQMSGGGSLPNIDNPRHDEIRGIVQPWFLPRRVGAHEAVIRAVVRGHTASWRETGRVDLAQQLAWPTPFDIFFSIMGIPKEDRAERDQLEGWVHGIKGRVPGTPEFTPHAVECDQNVRDYFIRLLQDRRTNPRDDVISTIVHAKINGVPFTEDHIVPAAEVMGLMMVLFLGGVESTAGLIGTTFKLLAEHPDQRRLLLDDPTLIPGALEEVLRWATPLQLTARTVMKDVTLHGVTIPKRSRVVLVTGAANRDERQFPDPDRFDVRRPIAKHVGFGEGVHGCLGAPLARLDAKIVLEEALPVLGEYELAGPAEFYPSSPNMYVWWKLPATFDAARARAQAGQGAWGTPSGVPAQVEQVARLSGSVTLAASEFTANVRVVAKDPIADGIVALTLGEVEGRPLPAWEPGAHVDLIFDGAPTRQYSLCGDPADRTTYRVGVLREAEGGGGSKHVHDHLAVGDVIRVRGPRNNFPFLPAKHYLFIAGGIGITPLLPMIAAAEAAGADWRLVYAGRRRATMAFRGELSKYGERVTLAISDENGRPDLAALLDTPRPDTLVYCCGPERLIAGVEAQMTGWPKRTLHAERFSPKPIEHGPDTAFEVVLKRSGLTLPVPADRSILDVVDAAGVGVLSSCRVGTCGTCETRLLEGEPEHRDSVLDEDEQAANDCLMICCSRSKGPRLVLDL